MHNFLTVHNVRHGFATNSSSTHSIVYMRGQKLTPVPASSGFGWDDFTLTDRGDKRTYLAAQVYQSLCHSVGSDVALTVAQAWTGAALTPDGGGGIEEYVDHQSVISFPSSFDGKGICREYVEDFARFLDRDDVAILGGNDNSDGHPDLDRGDVESVGVRDGLADVAGGFVARKDPSGFWTLFNRVNGNKLRVSFGNGGLMEAPAKAVAPELVDVKITNWCARTTGCADFCYQNSTTKGRHADKASLDALSYALKELRVFEVALGGGETTAHPDFVSILDSFRWAGVVPNFTTKDLSWLRDKDRAAKILERCGAFAYSAETAHDVEVFADVWKAVGWKKDSGTYPPVEKAVIQHVVGTTDEASFKALLLACHEAHLPVTLLGYKTVGRGLMFQPTIFNWVGVVKDLVQSHHLRIGIDTVLAETGYQALKDAGVPDWCVTRKEGKFSAYIDAVEGKMGPSSFCKRNEYSPLSLKGGSMEVAKNITQTFQTY
jgi:hypothetical protein